MTDGGRLVAVVPVRMGSSRLPKKPLLCLGGKPLLSHILERVRRCRAVDDIVVATATTPENDAIEAYCRAFGVACFRGAEEDVLGRLLAALDALDATTGLLVFGDQPLIDPGILTTLIDRFHAAGGAYDLVGNDMVTTFPPGMDAEVFKVSALRDAARNCSENAIREHGTLFIRQNPGRYRVLNVEAEGFSRRPELELEIDTSEDVKVVTAVLDHFGTDTDVRLDEIIRFLDANPNISRLNQSVPRRWKKFRNENDIPHSKQGRT